MENRPGGRGWTPVCPGTTPLSIPAAYPPRTLEPGLEDWYHGALPAHHLMWFLSPYTPVSRALLYLVLLVLLVWPAAVKAGEENETATLAACDAGFSAAPSATAVQLALTGKQVQATLSMPLSPLPAAGCVVPIPFQVPKAFRPPFAIWRDVLGQALWADGTSDSVPLRLWIQPDGVLQYEVRMADPEAAELAYDLALGWGTTAAANEQAVLHILMAALGVELERAVHRDASGRVTDLDWNHTYQDHVVAAIDHQRWENLHSLGILDSWALPSELGQLTHLKRLKLGGPLLTGTIPPELGQLTNLWWLELTDSRLSGAVPPELAGLWSLAHLDLSTNQLTMVPTEIGQLLKLTHLDLSGESVDIPASGCEPAAETKNAKRGGQPVDEPAIRGGTAEVRILGLERQSVEPGPARDGEPTPPELAGSSG